MRDVGWCFFMIPGRQWPFTAGGLLLDSVQGVVRLFVARVALCSLASRAGSILLLLLLVKKKKIFCDPEPGGVPRACLASRWWVFIENIFFL